MDIATLWDHQVQAIRGLSTLERQPHNTVVATGTGSGKIEAFFKGVFGVFDFAFTGHVLDEEFLATQ